MFDSRKSYKNLIKLLEIKESNLDSISKITNQNLKNSLSWKDLLNRIPECEIICDQNSYKNMK